MSFYKFDGDELLAGDHITLPGRDLVAADHAGYTYPVQGWYWFDTEAAARAALGVSQSKDVILVIKAANGTRLFTIRFDPNGVYLSNVQTVTTAKLDVSGGTTPLANVSLAATGSRFLALTTPLVYPPTP